VIVLDENISPKQRQILEKSRVACRHIGHDLEGKGLTDQDIIPLLHHLSKATLFTCDRDFFRSGLCHDRYCLVWLDVGRTEVGKYIRRFLRHPEFNTKRKRMGSVIHVGPGKIKVWRKNAKKPVSVSW
jgi:hypothetical protein